MGVSGGESFDRLRMLSGVEAQDRPLNIYGVIMAGGSGTRLWPLSRQAFPKFLLHLKGKSLLEATIHRLGGIVSPGCARVVCGPAHVAPIRRQMRGLRPRNFIVEPVARNTAPCIGLAAIRIVAEDPEAVMVVVPADHFITEAQKFRRVIRKAIRHAVKYPELVTVGIVPTNPHTGYGYIEVEKGKKTDTLPVKNFVEKPDLKTARKYLRSGRHYWNGGIFVGRAFVFLEEIREHMPELFHGLQKIRAGGSLEKNYPKLPSQSIDYGVMEKSRCLALVPGDFDWCDVGDLVEFARLGKARNDLIEIEGEDNLLLGENRCTVTLGVSHLVIVQTPDALLVTTRDRAQEVRKIPAFLSGHHAFQQLR